MQRSAVGGLFAILTDTVPDPRREGRADRREQEPSEAAEGAAPSTRSAEPPRGHHPHQLKDAFSTLSDPSRTSNSVPATTTTGTHARAGPPRHRIALRPPGLNSSALCGSGSARSAGARLPRNFRAAAGSRARSDNSVPLPRVRQDRGTP
ncbi:hypothetical protein [Streptomyces sp. R41]|uniref:Uncharacterized protein n=1 Tax=Streptomyces sp. R41 TaxID=3238632 RepID=A0AB39RG21_9ACTN